MAPQGVTIVEYNPEKQKKMKMLATDTGWVVLVNIIADKRCNVTLKISIEELMHPCRRIS